MSTSDDLRAHLGALFGSTGASDEPRDRVSDRVSDTLSQLPRSGLEDKPSDPPLVAVSDPLSRAEDQADGASEPRDAEANSASRPRLTYPGTAPVVPEMHAPNEADPQVNSVGDRVSDTLSQPSRSGLEDKPSDPPLVAVSDTLSHEEAEQSVAPTPPEEPTVPEKLASPEPPAEAESESAGNSSELDAWFAGETERSDFNASGYEFAREEAIFELPPPDEWPAFTDADTAAQQVRIQREEAQARRQAEEEAAARAVPEPRILRRFAGALGVLALAGGAGYGLMQAQNSPDVYDVPVAEAAPSPQQLACFGAFTRAFDTGIDVHEVDEAVNATSRLYATGSAIAGEATVAAGITDGLELAGVIEGEAAGTALAGASIHSAQAGDMRGLASAACAVPAMDVMLVGSSSLVGTSNDLILVNPGATPVEVRVQAFGSAGELSVSSAERVVVAARSIERVGLDGLLDADSRIALRLTADSGSFGAAVQSTALDGANPAGVSYVPASSLGTHLVIPGISATGTWGMPSLRIVNPSEEASSAHVTLIGESGAVALEGLENVELGPFSVLDISLAGLDTGVYTAVVDAASDVAAGAQLVEQQSDESARDVAWAGAVRGEAEGRAILTAPATRVAFYAEEGAQVNLVPLDEHGNDEATITVDVPAGQVRIVDMPAAAAARFEADAHVYAGFVGLMPVNEGNGIDWASFTPRAESAASRHIALQ